VRSSVCVLTLIGSLVFATGAGAGTLVIASGAGTLPATAEDLTGVEVGEIQGSLSGTDPNDVNVFEIDILNPLDFSAITINAGPFGIPDTELFLFDSTGAGIYFNDDISGANTLSCLPSSDASNPCPSPAGGLGPHSPGDYFLAITRSFNGPLDSLSNEIFTNVLSTDVVGPNTGVGAIAGWDDTGNPSPNSDLVNYDILLTGTTPEPATWYLLIAALGGFAALHRAVRPRRFRAPNA